MGRGPIQRDPPLPEHIGNYIDGVIDNTREVLFWTYYLIKEGLFL